MGSMMGFPNPAWVSLDATLANVVSQTKNPIENARSPNDDV
jgi:hypothetical protein